MMGEAENHLQQITIEAPHGRHSQHLRRGSHLLFTHVIAPITFTYSYLKYINYTRTRHSFVRFYFVDNVLWYNVIITQQYSSFLIVK